ncbi:MAG: glycoside hydrolase family 25 protein [Bacteroidetes bacterium]|nr:glycoside hydrolase family 25 protein [Bacteroidota bacterium]
MYKKKRTRNGKNKYLLIIGLLLIIFSFCYHIQISRIAIRLFYFVENQIYKNNANQSKNLKHFGIPIPGKYAVHGIDVSRYQDYIDWKEVKKMKVDSIKISFAFIKATEGKCRIDRFFSINWENAKKNQIIRGAYHFYRPQVSSKLQAENFISNVKLEKGDLPPVLDIETLVTGYQVDNTIRGIKNWLKVIEKAYHVKPIIYTNIDFYNNYLTDEGLGDYPLWIAHYYQEKVRLNQIWYFWQHNDKGKVNGIKGEVDFNVFNGNMEDLQELCKK